MQQKKKKNKIKAFQKPDTILLLLEEYRAIAKKRVEKLRKNKNMQKAMTVASAETRRTVK